MNTFQMQKKRQTSNYKYQITTGKIGKDKQIVFQIKSIKFFVNLKFQN